MNYLGWNITHQPSRPPEQRYVAVNKRLDEIVYSSSAIGLYGCVNHAIHRSAL